MPGSDQPGLHVFSRGEIMGNLTGNRTSLCTETGWYVFKGDRSKNPPDGTKCVSEPGLKVNPHQKKHKPGLCGAI